MSISYKTDILIRELLAALNRAGGLSELDKRLLAERSLEAAQQICDEASCDKRTEVIEAALVLRQAAEELGILKCCPHQVADNLMSAAAAARALRISRMGLHH